jgi:hypothetical protein
VVSSPSTNLQPPYKQILIGVGVSWCFSSLLPSPVISPPSHHCLPSLLLPSLLPPIVVSPPSCCHLPSLLSLSPLPLVVVSPPTLQAGACSGGGGGITPVPLSHCYHWSTRDPPHEQLLVRLGVGGVLHCWSSLGVVVMPPLLLS